MKPNRRLFILCLGFYVLGCAKAGTHSLSLRYQPTKEFSSLQQKIGSTLAMAPFEDQRSDTLYIGLHTTARGEAHYFKSDPFPLEKAIQESLSNVLIRYGVKILPLSHWDGRPESLKNMETDSVLMVEIKKFWTDGEASTFKTKMKVAVQLTLHLGVKKEGKVFTRNVEAEREMTVARSTPEKVEAMINQILADIFDGFLSHPY
ncbi:MAG: hypothetical protein HXY44_10205 [Syntrophaceae bacterium]|nr:hypothetical protein [Syntrophaceae bacterium]